MKNNIYTPKQLALMRMWQKNRLKRINLLEGSVRSGKTWISLVLWAFWVKCMPKDKNYLMTGKTLTSLRRNVLDLLQELVGTNHFTYSLGQKEGMLFGRKIYLEGVNDSRSESKIRGMTLQGAYCDELTLFSEDFFTMLLSRLSELGAKVIATTNPDNPNHWLMQKYILRKDELDMSVMKFLIDDNTFLDPEYVENLKKEYVGVFYDRFILGIWKPAEGVVYRLFADDPQRYQIAELDVYLKESRQRVERMSFGVDFGGNQSATAFIATALTSKGCAVIVDERYLKCELNPDSLNREFAGFIEAVTQKYGGGETRADSAESVLIRGLDHTARKNQLQTRVKLAMKISIVDRIRLVNLLMAQDRFKIMSHCKHVRDALSAAVYDSKKLDDTRLDDGTTNIDSLDAFEYSIEPYYKQLEAAGFRR